MDNAFEQIKKTEVEADSIIAEIKEKISLLKKELNDELQKAEENYQIQLESFRQQLAEEEEKAIALRISLMDQEFQKETEVMEGLFAKDGKDMILELAGKVIGRDGNSDN